MHFTVSHRMGVTTIRLFYIIYFMIFHISVIFLHKVVTRIWLTKDMCILLLWDWGLNKGRCKGTLLPPEQYCREAILYRYKAAGGRNVPVYYCLPRNKTAPINPIVNSPVTFILIFTQYTYISVHRLDVSMIYNHQIKLYKYHTLICNHASM